MCSRCQLERKYQYSIMTSAINPLHPNIKMHILHTVLYKFPKVVVRRIYLIGIISFILVVYVCDSGMQILQGEIRF